MLINKNIWYVYSHTRLDKNEIFYIGIGKIKNYGRAYEKDKSKRNIMWNRVVDKTEYSVKILFEGLNKEEVIMKEKELIKFYGRKDLGTGILTNMTDGGDGVWGIKWTNESRLASSLSKMGESNPMYGKKQNPETLAKRKENTKYKQWSDEDKIKMSLNTIKSGQAKAVDVYKYKTNEYIGRYHAICEACRQLGFHQLNGKASAVAQGKRRHTQNYVFKYVS